MAVIFIEGREKRRHGSEKCVIYEISNLFNPWKKPCDVMLQFQNI